MSGMKFRDRETGEVFENIKMALNDFCNRHSAEQCFAHGCPIDAKARGNGGCIKWAEKHPIEAAWMMGYEVIEEKEDGMEKTDKPRPAEAGDAVNHPAHYTQGGIECIEALKAATAGLEGIEAVCTANAIKYLWRWKHKGGVQDLDKAMWYIKRLKEEAERSERDE